MSTLRPNPDLLLAEVSAAEKKSSRGKLKIFFGSNAGVGKTFAMLDERHVRNATEGGEGCAIGYAESHIRPETELLLWLDLLPVQMGSSFAQRGDAEGIDPDAAASRVWIWPVR